MTNSGPQTATPVELPTVTRRKITEFFTRDEIKMLTERFDLMGFAAVGLTWSVIAITFVVLAWASSQPMALAVPLFLLGMIVIAGRQLALSILMHEASHGTLFKTRWLNDTFTDWLCARPVWNDLQKYRAHHFIHHTKTGTAEDSDISLTAPFPTTRLSLLRKLLRDISGITGIKFLVGRLLMDAGFIKWTVANDVQKLPQEGRTVMGVVGELVHNITPMLLMNGLLFTALWVSGHPWLYAIWVLSYLTPFSLFVRIRSIAEHGCTEKTPDMFRNTRTTRAGFFARATVAPFNVNYHIEHHVMASVPYFRLKTMRRMLRDRGAVAASPSYLDVLKEVSSA